MPDSLAALEARIRERLTMPLPGAAAQQRFAARPAREGWTPDLRPDGARVAAALILLFARAGEVRVPLTVRHLGLPQHAGQVSLPGGAIDAGESIDAAALREAEEEIGVAAADVRVLGVLSSLWVPVSNFVIHPVIGITEHEPSFRVHEREVAALIELPLSSLRDPAVVRSVRRVRDGVDIEYRVFEVDGHTVWGATAMVLSEFLEVCGGEPAEGRG